MVRDGVTTTAAASRLAAVDFEFFAAAAHSTHHE